MNKISTRLFLLLSIIVCTTIASAQTITIRPVDAGPYGRGSSIGVSIKIDFSTGYFKRTGNTFRLYLSDANGSFATQREIGSFSGFYTSYVNGIIPNSGAITAGTKYRVRVIADEPNDPAKPDVISTQSNEFSIVTSAGFTAAISSPTYLQSTSGTQHPDIFGLCEGANNRVFNFSNETTGATVTANVFNEGTNASVANLTFSPGANFTASTTNYTITAKAVIGSVVAIKCYPLINNRVFTNLGTSGSNVVCKDANTELPFFIDYESQAAGIQNNYPGLTYRITYGDGEPPETFSFFEIRAKDGSLTHEYKKSSCGFDAGGDKKGVFRVELQSMNPYCGNVGTASPQFAQVLEPAVNSFNVQATGCVGKAVSFTNTSNPGQSPNSSTGSCANPNARYTWRFDDGTQLTNKRINDPITHVFNTPGNHTATLVFQPGPDDKCVVADVVKTICILTAPVPVFTIPATACTDNNIAVNNNSTYDNSNTCTTITPIYNWTVTPATGFTYEAGTNSASANPVFRFNQAGKYSVRLSITAGCDAVTSAPKEIIVDAAPTVTLSNAVTFCQVKLDVPFNETAVETKTVITGTAEDESPNYEWSFPTVPAGAAAPVFVNSTKNSRYPTIRFDGAGTYVVRVRHQNNCGAAVVRDQQITLRNAPQLDPKFTALICPDAVSDLNANLTAGTYNTLTWQSTDPNGTFPGGTKNSEIAQYKPSAAEIAAGKATLKLIITTNIAGCETIESSPFEISIEPVNDVTTPSTKTICTNTSVNYTIISGVATSDYSWRIISNSPSITGFSPTGTSKTINDVLVNSSAEAGTVVYEITPINGNCTGNIHQLTVTVDPTPAPDFIIVGKNYGCGTTSITFRNTSASTTNGKFFWDFGDGNGPVENNNVEFTHSFEPFANGDGSDRPYVITLRQENSCGSVAAPQQRTVRIKPAVPVPLVANAPVKTNPTGDPVECGSFTLTVKNDSKGSDETYHFTLEDEDGNPVPANVAAPIGPKTDKSDAVFVVNAVETTTYYVNMTATNQCGTSASIPFRWPVTVTVSGQSIMTIKDAKNQSCVNEDVVFINGSKGTSFTYTIYKDGNTATPYRKFGAPLGETPFKFTEPGNYNVTVTATSGNCGAASPSSFNSNKITILATPEATFTNATVNCTNTIQFTPAAPTDPTFIYAWDFDDGTTSNDPTPSHPFVNSGSYDVKLTVTNALGCGGTFTQPVVVSPDLKAGFTVLPGEEIFIPNYHFSFKDNSEGNPGKWLWDFGNGDSSELPNPEYTYPATDIGSHVVKLTVTRESNGAICTSTIQKTVTISGTPGTLFIPNAFIPSSSSNAIQTFMAKGSGLASWHMQIFNKWGQLVWETNKLGADGEPLEGWDGTYKGAPAPQGAYVWQVTAKFINGTEWKGMSYRNSLPKRSGVVNLIR